LDNLSCQKKIRGNIFENEKNLFSLFDSLVFAIELKLKNFQQFLFENILF